MTEKNEKRTRSEMDLLKIEGYKSLTQYGCQLSQDQLNYDKILLPLLIAAPLLVLDSDNTIKTSKTGDLIILIGGLVFLVFWHLRNWRSRVRLYAIWDTLLLIEEQLEFEAHRTLRKCMNKRRCSRFRLLRIRPPRDFTLKRYFGYVTIVFYICVVVYVAGWR